MANLENIAEYFEGTLSVENKKLFEQRIIDDEEFAEEVAFYLTAKTAATEIGNQEKNRFRAIYSEYKLSKSETRRPRVVRIVLPWVAAAAILAAVVFGMYAWFKPESSVEIADKYISSSLERLPVTMASKADSIQTAIGLYNKGDMQAALRQFESISDRDSSVADTKKYLGIVSLRLGEYEKALGYFKQLESMDLYSNPGKFFLALTLMKRDDPTDSERAKQLLEEVVANDLEGKPIAEQWLKKW